MYPSHPLPPTSLSLSTSPSPSLPPHLSLSTSPAWLFWTVRFQTEKEIHWVNVVNTHTHTLTHTHTHTHTLHTHTHSHTHTHRYFGGKGFVLHHNCWRCWKDTLEDVPVVEITYLVFTRMPGESYCRGLTFFLCLCDVFRALINSLVCR